MVGLIGIENYIKILYNINIERNCFMRDEVFGFINTIIHNALEKKENPEYTKEKIVGFIEYLNEKKVADKDDVEMLNYISSNIPQFLDYCANLNKMGAGIKIYLTDKPRREIGFGK